MDGRQSPDGRHVRRALLEGDERLKMKQAPPSTKFLIVPAARGRRGCRSTPPAPPSAPYRPVSKNLAVAHVPSPAPPQTCLLHNAARRTNIPPGCPGRFLPQVAPVEVLPVCNVRKSPFKFMDNLFRFAEPRAQRLCNRLWSFQGSQVPTLGNNDEIRMRGQSGHFLMVRQRCQSVIFAA